VHRDRSARSVQRDSGERDAERGRTGFLSGECYDDGGSDERGVGRRARCCGFGSFCGVCTWSFHPVRFDGARQRVGVRCSTRSRSGLSIGASRCSSRHACGGTGGVLRRPRRGGAAAAGNSGGNLSVDGDRNGGGRHADGWPDTDRAVSRRARCGRGADSSAPPINFEVRRSSHRREVLRRSAPLDDGQIRVDEGDRLRRLG